LNKLILTLLLLFSSLQAEFCIQVASSKDKKTIMKEANSPKYSDFKKLRIEKRGSYLVMRIGQYYSRNTADSDLVKVRRIVRDAFVRTCTFSPNKTLYLKDDNQYLDSDYYTPPSTLKEAPLSFETEERYEPEPKVETSRYTNSVKEQSNYIESEELVYSSTEVDENENENLWDQCRKCFSPIYSQEEEAVYITEKVVQPKKEEIVQIKKNKLKTNEIQVRIKQKDIQEENNSFWTNKELKNDVNLKDNNLNINEQFLP